ncbi:hypothetical protein ES332_D09G096700v1 [Gossypium tomentosum]|uniref:Uncharacterized protein n=1 Tax=Gossypium tomentosum TaxID=34277 RepID=A0A5D2JFE7_GOSTO|nr:hypothetical protein ES332_D09G096700v1 [Gossypium tomentosum]
MFLMATLLLVSMIVESNEKEEKVEVLFFSVN